ncbi:MAG: sulfatase-like hydrolase/transferase [Promethearchaeota archaeon]
MLNLKDQKIENIFIFVSDSLRWDFTPEKVKKMGITLKTIASSLYTASSFASIISGLYPPKHGVYTWQDILPRNVRGLLGFDTHTVSLWCETTWTDLPPDKSQIHTILGDPAGISLENIESPFIYIEDDKGGHCPYGYSFGEFMGGGCPDFFKEYGKKSRAKLIKQYKRGIEQSVMQFEKRLRILEERGLVNNTLVIFTSDHGELLGEYGGLIGHGRPPCPELTYVPTVFIHPSFKQELLTNGLCRHVDLYPTIAGILGVDGVYTTDGVNLTEALNLPKRGLNFKKEEHHESKDNRSKKWKYGCNSIWDYNGGHIFHDLNKNKGGLMFFYKIFIKKHPEFNFLRERNSRLKITERFHNYVVAIKGLSKSHIKYNQPNLSKNQAKRLIEKYLAGIVEIKTKKTVIDEEVEKRLRALGYLD